MMKNTLRVKASILSAALIGFSAVMVGSTAAHSGEPSGFEFINLDPDRVVVLNEKAPVLSETRELVSKRVEGDTVISVWKGAELPVVPEPGEIVKLVYQDAVTMVATDPLSGTTDSLAAACTKSMTVNPTHVSGGALRAYASASVSSGCSGNSSYILYVYENGLNLAFQSTSVTVWNDGFSYSVDVGKACRTTQKISHQPIGVWGAGGSVYGPTNTLPCKIKP